MLNFYRNICNPVSGSEDVRRNISVYDAISHFKIDHYHSVQMLLLTIFRTAKSLLNSFCNLS